jgi:hypothetical protein
MYSCISQSDPQAKTRQLQPPIRGGGQDDGSLAARSTRQCPQNIKYTYLGRHQATNRQHRVGRLADGGKRW